MSNNSHFTPKHTLPAEGFMPLTGRRIMVSAGSKAAAPEAQRLVGRLKKEFGINAGLAKSAGRNTMLRLNIRPDLPAINSNPEGFALRIDNDGVRLESAGAPGLFYGADMLIRRLERRAGGWGLPYGEVRDWPDSKWRGFMLDPARKFVPMPRVLRCLDWMAENRLNVLHMHFADNEQFTLELPRHPLLNRRMYNYMCCGPIKSRPYTFDDIERVQREYAGVYSHADIRAMVQYAAERHIQVIPEIEFPSHCIPILKNHPELMCNTGVPVSSGSGKRPSESIVCIGNPGVYKLFGEIVDTIAPLFPAPYLHVGADEIDCPIIPLAKRSWDRCSVCGSVMRRKGYANVHALFYDAMRRMRRIVAGHGKRMIMWNDYIDIAKPVDLPHDIIMQFWRIADKRWPVGPRHGCSYAKFAKAGFEIINSHYPETYLDGCVNDRKLASWQPDQRPPLPAEFRSKVLGGEMCAWSWHAHFPYSIPPALAFFGQKLWDHRPVKNLPDYARALARHLFGSHAPAALEDVFEGIGSIVPPNIRSGPEKTLPGRTFTPAEATLPGRRDFNRRQYETLLRAMDKAAGDKRIHNRDVLEEFRISVAEAAGI